jgi:hypothetical protein
MEDRLARVEGRLAELESTVARLEARIASAGGGSAPEALEGFEQSPLVPEIGAATVQQWLALVGRTLVVLGGAYLLRALTGASVLPAHVGVSLGLIYGAPWLFLASRAAARGGHLDALCHGLATALIGYPLVWEATTRFGALSPAGSAVLLGLLTGAALVLSFRTSLHSLAWIVTLGALLSAMGLAMATGNWVVYTALALAVGIGALWLGYTREWILLRWPAAGIANFMMFVAAGRSLSDGSSAAVLLVQFLMLTGYLGSFAWRTLVIGRDVIPFEVAQSIAVLAVAFGGAIFLIQSTGANVAPFAAGTLALAAAGYVVAFAFVERRLNVKNFFFYTLLALVFSISGIALSFGAAAGSVLFGLVAVAAAAGARRYQRFTLSLHAAIYAAAGVITSGLLGAATGALVLSSVEAWTPPSVLSLIQLVFLALLVSMPGTPSRGPFAFGPRLALVIMLVWTSMGAAVALIVPAVWGSRAADPAVLGSIRTAVMIAATLIVARSARSQAGREAGWLVYPLLMLTGAKLAFADFLQGRPATLFVSLAFYGLALIVAPRLLRERGKESAPTAGPSDLPVAVAGATAPPRRPSPGPGR